MDDHVNTHVTTIHSFNLTEQQSVKKDEEESDFKFHFSDTTVTHCNRVSVTLKCSQDHQNQYEI